MSPSDVKETSGVDVKPSTEAIFLRHAVEKNDDTPRQQISIKYFSLQKDPSKQKDLYNLPDSQTSQRAKDLFLALLNLRKIKEKLTDKTSCLHGIGLIIKHQYFCIT